MSLSGMLSMFRNRNVICTLILHYDRIFQRQNGDTDDFDVISRKVYYVVTAMPMYLLSLGKFREK